MNVLDGLSKQLQGRGLSGKTVLEGAVWFGDLHKMLTTFGEDLAKFSAGAATTEALEKFLQKSSDSAKALQAHMHADAIALALMGEVSAKRKPDDLGVEGAPSYMKESDGGAATIAALNAKALECGIDAEAWKASGIPAHLGGIAQAAATVKGTLEIVAGADKLTDGTLDDRFFEIHYAATGQVGNRHIQDKPNEPGLPTSCAKLLKAMKREMMLIKAPAR
jgi:hypothetical protein